ncbi:hypothetical protein R6Z07F_010050 [Ovis aries]
MRRTRDPGGGPPAAPPLPGAPGRRARSPRLPPPPRAQGNPAQGVGAAEALLLPGALRGGGFRTWPTRKDRSIIVFVRPPPFLTIRSAARRRLSAALSGHPAARLSCQPSWLMRRFNGSQAHQRPVHLRHQGKVKIFAPNAEQMHIINHLKESPAEERRNVLEESARRAMRMHWTWQT